MISVKVTTKRLRNKPNALHEAHPFHILPPSALPFFVAMILGLSAGTFAYLLHRDNLKEAIPFLSLAVGDSPDY